MTDRIQAAVAELVDALRAELQTASPAVVSGPIALLSPVEFARRSSLGRSSIYLAIADQTIRSVRVRGRRLIPASELLRLGNAAPPAKSGTHVKKTAPTVENVGAAVSEVQANAPHSTD
jgi:hypothetical protein